MDNLLLLIHYKYMTITVGEPRFGINVPARPEWNTACALFQPVNEDIEGLFFNL